MFTEWMWSLSKQDRLALAYLASWCQLEKVSVRVTALSQGSQQGEGLRLEVLATQPGSPLFISNNLYLLRAPVPAFPSSHQESPRSHSAGQRVE